MSMMAEQIEEEPGDAYDVSVRALRTKTKNLVSALLNPPKVIPTEEGLPRDWQGLAELVGVGGECIPQLQVDLDPTLKVLQVWEEKSGSTIRQFVTHLEKLDRFDVIDDIVGLLDDDIKYYKEKVPNGIHTVNLDNDKHILTVDDVNRINQGLAPQNYDAFVLFADDDINFAMELIETMEKQRNLKICVKDRDLVGGAFEHEVIIKLIAERCNRLIVIISPSFIKSSANKFFVNFAQSIGIEQRQRKIIPCMYTQCEVPLELKCYYIIDYNRTSKMWNFWDRLYDSIRTPECDSKKKSNLNRSASHQVRSKPRTDLKPSVQSNYGYCTLKTKKQCVLFKSLVDLRDDEVEEPQLNPSPSLSTVSVDVAKKAKPPKTNWIKKLLHAKTASSKPPDEQEKEKRKFWQRHSKRKVAVAN